MLTFAEQKELVKAASKACHKNAPANYALNGENFSKEDLSDAVRSELNELCGDYNSYRRNKNTVFELMEIAITEYLPVKVMEQFGQFAEIKRISQGARAEFVQRVTEASRKRAKKFVTHVGLAGRYETFKLDGRKYEVPTDAIGGAARIEFEEFLDGRMNMQEMLAIVVEGMDDLIYAEIMAALESLASIVQDTNNYSNNEFVEEEMDKLLAIADSYSVGGKSTIYCTFAFAATMVPAQGWFSDAMKEAKWQNGYLANYKGHNVVVLDQSYTDTTNETKVVNDKLAYIFPAGAEKPVKIVYEGDAHVREVTDNDDWSTDIHMYTKVGVGLITETHHVCVYENTSL